MKRLTERDEYGNADIIGVDSCDLQGNLNAKEMNLVTNALNKLAAYEDEEFIPLGEVKELLKEAREEIQNYYGINTNLTERIDAFLEVGEEG